MPKDKKLEDFIANKKLLEKSTEYPFHVNIWRKIENVEIMWKLG